VSELIIDNAGGLDASSASGLAPERLDLRTRHWAPITSLLIGVHGAAAVLIWSAPRWPWLCVAATLLGAASLVLSLRRVRAPSGVILECRADAPPSARVYLRGAGELAGLLHGSTFVSVPLVILRLRSPGAWRCASVLLPTGALGAHAHRRLRIWLRWRAVPGLARGRAVR